MADAEQYAELNRLISGELSQQEALGLMRRMLRDDELREAYEQLLAADELAREATFGRLAEAGGPPLGADGTLEAGRREQQIGAILARTSQAPGRRPRRGRPWWRAEFFRRWAPPLTAAAGLVILGLALAAWEPWEEQGTHFTYHGPSPIDEHRIARLRQHSEAAGNAVVIMPRAGEDYRQVDADTPSDVIVCVTIVRDDQAEPWGRDAMIPRDCFVPLVLEGLPGWQPQSLEVRVAADSGGKVPVTLRATLTPEAQVCQTANIVPRQPEQVAEVRSGGVQFRVFIEVRPERPGEGSI